MNCNFSLLCEKKLQDRRDYKKKKIKKINDVLYTLGKWVEVTNDEKLFHIFIVQLTSTQR